MQGFCYNQQERWSGVCSFIQLDCSSCKWPWVPKPLEQSKGQHWPWLWSSVCREKLGWNPLLNLSSFLLLYKWPLSWSIGHLRSAGHFFIFFTYERLIPSPPPPSWVTGYFLFKKDLVICTRLSFLTTAGGKDRNTVLMCSCSLDSVCMGKVLAAGECPKKAERPHFWEVQNWKVDRKWVAEE